MGRPKGIAMTDEQKAAAKAKRDAKKTIEAGDKYNCVLSDIKSLSVFQLKTVVEQCNKLIEKKKEQEKEALKFEIELLQKKMNNL